MARSNEALEMEGEIAALDQKQREHAAMILALSEQLVELKSEKATVVKYKASLFKKRNTPTKKLGAEIKEIDKQLQENGKKAKKKLGFQVKQLQASQAKIALAIQDLVGPMCKTLRAALRRLGVELTVYWSGTFVGPQIAKLHLSKHTCNVSQAPT